MGKSHIERCCDLAKPKAILATPKAHLLRLISPALQHIPVKFATGYGVPGAMRWQTWTECTPDGAIFSGVPDSPALATFTSGSTGQPKMAVRTHGFLRQQHAVLVDLLALTLADVVLTTLPIFVLSHLGAGVATLIPSVDLRHPGHVDPAALIQQILDHRVTCIEASPAFLEQLTRYSSSMDRTLSGVTKVFTGGAPVFPDLLDQTQAMAPEAIVTAVYGSTEAEPIAHIVYGEIGDADKQAMRQGQGLLAGEPVPAIQVRVLPDRWGSPIGPFALAEFERQRLPPGATGEIVVSGPHVLKGYWRGQGDLETKFRAGKTIWHRTGDAGSLDAQGRLWLLGRCAARIDDQHGTIYPFTVECAVHQFDQIKRAAFVAYKDQRLLVLELYSGDNDALLAAIREELAWAHIDEVRVVKHLPVDKRHNAKIDYVALHKMLGLT